MTFNDESIDESILGARPNPIGPTAELVDRQRTQLTETIAEGASRSSKPEQPPEHTSLGGQLVDITTLDEVRHAPRWSHLTLAVAAAALLFAAVSVTNRSDESTEIATEAVFSDEAVPAGDDLGSDGETTYPAADDIASPSADDSVEDAADGPAQRSAEQLPADGFCGTELPIEVLLTDGTTVLDGPLPGYAPASDGQLIKHWTQNDVSFELRWPVNPQTVYGDDSTPSLAIAYLEGFDSDGDTVRRFYPVWTEGAASDLTDKGGTETVTFVASVTAYPDLAPSILAIEGAPFPSSETTPAFEITSVHDGTPATGCSQIGVRAQGSDGQQVGFSFGITDPKRLMGESPLVIEQLDAAEAPTQVVACDGAASDPEVPEFLERTLTIEEHHASPAEALQAFLAAVPAHSLSESGYTEITHPDGVTYTLPFDDDKYVALITVAKSDEGWAATLLQTSGC